jgi:hypothetical protein
MSLDLRVSSKPLYRRISKTKKEYAKIANKRNSRPLVYGNPKKTPVELMVVIDDPKEAARIARDYRETYRDPFYDSEY